MHILATSVDVDDYSDDDDNSDDDYNRTLVGGAGSDDICGVITECSSAGCRANDIAALCELKLLRLNSTDTNRCVLLWMKFLFVFFSVEL